MSRVSPYCSGFAIAAAALARRSLRARPTIRTSSSASRPCSTGCRRTTSSRPMRSTIRSSTASRATSRCRRRAASRAGSASPRRCRTSRSPAGRSGRSSSSKFEQGDDVFRRRRSLFFKKMQIVRGCDVKRNVLVYMVYSDRLIEGSPKNSTSTVPIMPWGTTASERSPTSAAEAGSGEVRPDAKMTLSASTRSRRSCRSCPRRRSCRWSGPRR